MLSCYKYSERMFVYELVQVEINPQSIGVFGRRVVGFSCIYMYIYLGGLKEEKKQDWKEKKSENERLEEKLQRKKFELKLSKA